MLQLNRFLSGNVCLAEWSASQQSEAYMPFRGKWISSAPLQSLKKILGILYLRSFCIASLMLR